MANVTPASRESAAKCRGRVNRGADITSREGVEEKLSWVSEEDGKCCCDATGQILW